MDSFAKIAGWTIAGAVIVALASKAATGTNISSILNSWSGVIRAITGGGGTTSGGGPSQGGASG